VAGRDGQGALTVVGLSFAEVAAGPASLASARTGRCPTTAATTTAFVSIQLAFSDAGRLALAGFLAGYGALTREAFALDLRQVSTWLPG
jgi:hypothetical protein